MTVELRDIAPGLWLWRQDHPDWHEGADWEPTVTSFAVVSQGTRIVIDALAPPEGETQAWERLDAFAPEVAIVLKPDHVRSVDAFAERYGLRALGPYLFYPDDIPRTELEPIYAGDALPGGLRAMTDGRGRMETPVYLPEQRALVFADGMTSLGGQLRTWASPAHEATTYTALRSLLALPFERVLVGHGDPVHTRADFIAALDRNPYPS